jgi:putative restriction endonuclease
MAVPWNSLKYFLADALSAYTTDFYLITNTNPILFSLNGTQYSTHISSIHDSGEGRENRDELRIQIQRTVIDMQKARSEEGIRARFIGFFPDGTVFTGWDPRHVFAQEPESGGSVYARQSQYDVASNFGAGIRIARLQKIRMEAAIISMRSEALGFYLENAEVIHTSRTDDDVRNLVRAVSKPIEAADRTGSEVTEVELAGERQRVTVTRSSYVRDPKFVSAVLEAYNGRCCVCERQLGLVQAAHIIPHSHPECLERVTNGLALCVLHHKLYDDALLLPSSGRQLFLNNERVEHLQNIGQDSGLPEVRRLAAQQYRVPEHEPSRPDDGFLLRGVRIRLGTDT